MPRHEVLTFREQIWRAVARFAYRRMMVGRPEKRPPDGLPGIRDPDSRCTIYSPRPREVGDFGDCNGDGHYLCHECCHLKRPEDDDE